MESKKKPPQDLATPLLSGICSEKKKSFNTHAPQSLLAEFTIAKALQKKKKKENIIHPEMNNKIDVLHITQWNMS